jgi:hypothetical protein
MTAESLAQPAPADNADGAAEVGLLSEIRRMATLIARSRERNRLLLLVAGLIVVVAGYCLHAR